MSTRPIQLMAFVTLFAMAAIGFVELTDYSSRPGDSGSIPAHLHDLEPSEPALAETSLAEASLPETLLPTALTDNQRQTLLFFYHPKCPCTTASVRVLERLLARCVDQPKLTAIAYCPPEENESWIETRTTNALSKLKHSDIIVDRNGQWSRQFGVSVSGHLLLYDRKGHLEFSGGITPYRGHEGDSPSSIDLLERLNSDTQDFRTWPVFGCTIVARTEATQ